MTGRDHNRLYAEAVALWRQVRDEPPPADADATTVLDLLLGSLPAPGYDRLTTPYLRSANIAFPKSTNAA